MPLGTQFGYSASGLAVSYKLFIFSSVFCCFNPSLAAMSLLQWQRCRSTTGYSHRKSN
jgi:hypothetical protein